MPKTTDACVLGARLFLLPIPTRVPLKFGTETLAHVTCLRVQVQIRDRAGCTAFGWGETPLSVQWGWPSAESYESRLRTMVDLAQRIARAWPDFGQPAHPLELGWDFVEQRLPDLLRDVNESRKSSPMPWLAALITSSAFDLALHDAYGHLLQLPTYHTYTPEFLNRDLASFLDSGNPGPGSGPSFRGRHPSDYLAATTPTRLRAWHLVGGLDPVSETELSGTEPDDGYPVLLADWIRRDGLRCLKIKLRGNDSDWDFRRMVDVGQLSIAHGVEWLTADFNCTVRDPEYVNSILDRLRDEYPRVFGMLLYVEQPFPYDLEANPIPAHSVSARKPLFLDESAHDWRLVRMGRDLGWNGVALKTCKTQSGALLSLCWARAHGMALMVQDLTNPMLAQIPHLLLAAHAGTIMGVESNAMQFYPEASKLEAEVHPGCYSRTGGCLDLESVLGPGFGLRVDEIRRDLPSPCHASGSLA